MNKFILAGAIAVAVISTSCRKQRTCECDTTKTTVISGYGAKTDIDKSSTKHTVEKQNKNEFRTTSDCFSTRESYIESGGEGSKAHTDAITIEKTCDLK